MGFFSGLDQEGYDRQYSDRQLVGRMVSYFRPHRTRLVAVIGLLVFIAVAGASVPIIVSRGLDILGPNLKINGLVLLCGLILFAGVSSWAANWLRRRLVVRIVGDIILRLRSEAFQAATGHDLSFYDEVSSGKVVSRITTDTNDFGQTVVLITDLFSQFTQSIILGVVMVQIDLRLSLYLFAFLPVVFGVAVGFRRLARIVTRSGMRAMANVNSTIKETVSGIAIAKNFRQERLVFDEFDLANQRSYAVNIRRGMVLSAVFPTLNALGGI